MNLDATLDQCVALIEAGCEMVRITAPGIKEARQLELVKNELVKKGYNIPLIADIHFNPKAAELAAGIVEKVRINPGNYADRRRSHSTGFTDMEYLEELERIAERIHPLIEICKKNDTAVRIGVNHGSLSERIMNRYGNTPEGMVESAIEYARIFREQNFNKLVLSMKSSDVKQMVYANRLLVRRLIEEGMDYPLHLGVTEAGDGEDGRIKSAAGIGSLLIDGIGDTIRVSLTEDPVKEIPVARMIAYQFEKGRYASPDIYTLPVSHKKKTAIPVVSAELPKNVIENEKYSVVSFNCKTDPGIIMNQVQNFGDRIAILNIQHRETDTDHILTCSSAFISKLMIDGYGDGIWIQARLNLSAIKEIELGILQSVGLRISKTDYIACPSCGRTQFDIQDALAKIREKTGHLKGLKIGVMGCIVNGPGEMADADYGYVGSGRGKITLYKGHEIIRKEIDEKDAVDALIELIRDNGDWLDL